MKRLLVLTLLMLCACQSVLPETPEPAISGSALPLRTASGWRPAPGDSFDLQFDDDLDLSASIDIYDLDLFSTDPSVIEGLHARDQHAVCYISIGSWEDWRPDADQFPEGVIGNDYEGWPGEKWLDIRRIEVLAPIMRARLDLCAAKGFDGVEPDNIEIYDNNSGFPITYQDQLAYAIWLAEEAHNRGLAIGLKNASDMAQDALPYYDFSVLEDCFYYDWCADLAPFVEAGKPVFAIEYTDMHVDFDAACREAVSLGITTILKHRDLDSFLETCP